MKGGSTLDYAILGLLTHEKLTGYDIKSIMGFRTGLFWSTPSFGSIYRSLEKLEESGLIDSTDEPGQKIRTKKVFNITSKGREILMEWLTTPLSEEIVLDEHVMTLPDGKKAKIRSGNMLDLFSSFLLKFYLSGSIPLSKCITQINDFEQHLLRPLASILDHSIQNLRDFSKNDSNSDHLYYLLTALLGEKMYKTFIEWKTEAIGLLEENLRY